MLASSSARCLRVYRPDSILRKNLTLARPNSLHRPLPTSVPSPPRPRPDIRQFRTSPPVAQGMTSTSEKQQEQSKNNKMTASEAFGSGTFDVDGYLSCRPRYPPFLFDWVRRYHFGGESSTSSSEIDTKGPLVDIGCGPGIAAFPLLPSFKKGLLGVDTSAKMVKLAPSALAAWPYPDLDDRSRQHLPPVQFAIGSDADFSALPLTEPESVSMAIAATAAHWFEYRSTWLNLSHHIRPGGTAIFWTYSEHFLPYHPDLQVDIREFMQGDDEAASLGPYFPQPGRTYLTNLLKEVPFPHEVGLEGFATSGTTRRDAGVEAANSEGQVTLPDELLQQWDLSSAVRLAHPLSDEGVADLSSYVETIATVSSSSPSASSASSSSSSSSDVDPLAERYAKLERYGPPSASSSSSPPSAASHEPFRMEQTMPWSSYEGYLRTSSAWHSYRSHHPSDEEDPRGDVITRFVEKIKGRVLQERRKRRGSGPEGVKALQEEGLSDDMVRVAWPMGLMAIKKKEK